MALLDHRTLITLKGKDALPFLQGLLTQDVYKITDHTLLYACLLTPQGRFLYDLFLFKEADEVLIDVEKARLEAFIKKLNLYKLRSEVSINLLSQNVFVYWEPNKQEGWCFNDPRSRNLGYRFYSFCEKETPNILEDYDYRRLKEGIPDGSRDMPIDKAIILEYGLENAIDWQKGCYIGQELMARTYHQGLVRKCFISFKVEGMIPENGTAIIQGDKKVGEIRTSAKNIAGGLIKKEALHLKEIPLRCGDAVLSPF